MTLDLRDRTIYRHWGRDIVRFQDLDRLGHVNNIAFLIYAETGRVAWAEQTWPGSTDGSGVGWTIVRLTCNYLTQAHFPGTVDIGTRCLKVGNSSATIGQGLFIGETCIATAESVVVWTDVQAGKGIAIPPEMRAALEE